MCYLEYLAINPKGCTAKNKHVHVIKDVIPCFETIAVSMLRNAARGGSPDELRIAICEDKDCMKIDCFRRRFEVKSMQPRSPKPYCPLCKGEKTLVEALMVNDDNRTEYAILPNRITLRITNDNTVLPRFLSQRKYFLEPETECETIRVKTKVADKMPYKVADHGLQKRKTKERETGKKGVHAIWPRNSRLYDLDPTKRGADLEDGLDWYYPDWLDE